MKKQLSVLISALLMLSMTACGAERSPSDTSKNEVQTQSSDKKDKNKSEEKEKDDKDKKTSEEKEDKDDKDDNDAEESSKRSEDSAYDAIYGLLSSEWAAHGDNTTTYLPCREDTPYVRLKGDDLYLAYTTIFDNATMYKYNIKSKELKELYTFGYSDVRDIAVWMCDDQLCVYNETSLIHLDLDGNVMNEDSGVPDVLESLDGWEPDGYADKPSSVLSDGRTIYYSNKNNACYLLDAQMKTATVLPELDGYPWGGEHAILYNNKIFATTDNAYLDLASMTWNPIELETDTDFNYLSTLDDAMINGKVTGRYFLGNNETKHYLFDLEKNEIIADLPYNFMETYYGGDHNIDFNDSETAYSAYVYDSEGSKNETAELSEVESAHNSRVISDKYFVQLITDHDANMQRIYLCSLEGNEKDLIVEYEWK